jgi:OTU domain-containing protein 5
MKEIGGDGNCLFRSISDQLYGEETFHSEIRQMCMKYILQEKAFFQDFMVEDLDEYVARKSRDGVWGDDIEIEALS